MPLFYILFPFFLIKISDALSIHTRPEKTDSASSRYIPKTFGREREIREIIKGLTCRKDGNVLIVGQAEDQKNSIVDDMRGFFMDHESVLTKSLDKERESVWRVLDGTIDPKILSQSCKRAKGSGGIVEFKNAGPFLLKEPRFFDMLYTELHDSWDLHMIMTMEMVEYNMIKKTDPLWLKRFQVVKLKDYSRRNTRLALHKVPFESYYNVRVSPDNIVVAVQLAKDFLKKDSVFNSAYRLLDNCCSMISRERHKGGGGGDSQRKDSNSRSPIPMTAKNLHRALEMESSTKIKLAESIDDTRRLINIPKLLGEHIIGQESAVQEISKIIQKAEVGMNKEGQPYGSFLFVGPTGVGKSELSVAVAKHIFGDESLMLTLDMSEFKSEHTISKLIGSEHGKDAGRLTTFVRDHPKSIILFDEAEKAHPSILNILLQLLDEGRLTDASGVTADFTKCIIILTSNAGAHLWDDRHFRDFPLDTKIEHLMNVLKGKDSKFKLEVLNRFDSIVPFDNLNVDEMARLLDLKIRSVKSNITGLATRNIQLSSTERARKIVAENLVGASSGGRAITNIYLKNEMNLWVKKYGKPVTVQLPKKQ